MNTGYPNSSQTLFEQLFANRISRTEPGTFRNRQPMQFDAHQVMFIASGLAGFHIKHFKELESRGSGIHNFNREELLPMYDHVRFQAIPQIWSFEHPLRCVTMCAAANPIGPVGAIAIAERLTATGCSSLRTLNLSGTLLQTNRKRCMLWCYVKGVHLTTTLRIDKISIIATTG